MEDYTGHITTYWDTIKYALRRSSWQVTTPIFPRRCIISGKLLWFEPAVQGSRMITGPGTPIIETYWMSREAYTWWILTKDTNEKVD